MKLSTTLAIFALSLAVIAPAAAQTTTFETQVEIKRPRNLKADCSQLVADQTDLDEALRVCDEAVAASPEDGDLYYYRAYARYYRDEIAEAEADVTRAIELETSRLAKAYYLRGTIYERQRRLREAAADFRSALELAPDWTQARRKVDSYAWAYEDE